MKKFILAGITFTLLFTLLRPLYLSGMFKSIQPHSNLINVTIEPSMAGTEDLEIDQSGRFLFISSTDRRSLSNDGYFNSTTDGIYILELNAELKKLNPEPILLETDFKESLHPHGISYLYSKGHDYLFVVNHNELGDGIEKFEFTEQRLKHIQSYKNINLCCPNDLVAVSEEQFYVTNDHGSKPGAMRFIEDYLGYGRSSILYYDGQSYSVVASGFNYANGINVSNDGSKLYLTETTAGRISVFDRDINSGQLQLDFEQNLHTGLDNISVDVNDNLWIASHAKVLYFLKHAKSKENFSPSEVLKLTLTGKHFNVDSLYLNLGEQLSGSSVALHVSNENKADDIYVGVVFDNKLMRAQLK